MERTSITLKSGHVLELATPDFDAANRAFKTVARELLAVDIKLDAINFGDLKNFDAAPFVKGFLQIAQSDAVEKCFYECALQSFLQGTPIKRGAFNAEDMRQDYLPVAWEVMKRTLAPFFVGLPFLSSGLTGQRESNPR